MMKCCNEPLAGMRSAISNNDGASHELSRTSGLLGRFLSSG
jgi:hypothetical protein